MTPQLNMPCGFSLKFLLPPGFRFRIPVRCLSVWKNPRILGALCDTLGFLSEDEYAFEFVEAEKPQPLQSYIPFEAVDQSFAPDEVVLFSGGLDSLAGAIDAIMGAGKRLALVSHQSSTMVTSKQHGLLAALRLAVKFTNSLNYSPKRSAPISMPGHFPTSTGL